MANTEYTICSDMPDHMYGRFAFVAIADERGAKLKSVSVDPFRYITVSVDIDASGNSDHHIGSDAVFSSLAFVVRTACVEYGGDTAVFSRAMKRPNQAAMVLVYAGADGIAAGGSKSELVFMNVEITQAAIIDNRYFSTVELKTAVFTQNEQTKTSVAANARVPWNNTVCVTHSVAEEYGETSYLELVSATACESETVMDNSLASEIWAPTSIGTSLFCNDTAWRIYNAKHPGTRSPVKRSFAIVPAIAVGEVRQHRMEARENVSVTGTGGVGFCFRMDTLLAESPFGEVVIHLQSVFQIGMNREHAGTGTGRSLLISAMKRAGEYELRTRNTLTSFIMIKSGPPPLMSAPDNELNPEIHLNEAVLIICFIIASVVLVWILCYGARNSTKPY